MESIERISSLNIYNLSEEFYFNSLLAEAYRQGLLDETDIEKIQMECLELLAYKIEGYTRGKSSSVPVELAESIMKSNLFTIGLYLKSFPSPDDAVKALTAESISQNYTIGKKRIEIKLKSAKHLHHKVIGNLLETENYTYSSTVVDGIKGFFRIYNADFEAQEIHISADYPLFNPIKDLIGIEFIVKYLESVYYENMFCKYFTSEAIHHLLCGYDEHYQDLIMNLFEQVFTCAIGCVLAETAVVNLHLSVIQIEGLYALLSEKTRDEAETIIVDAYHKLLTELAITNPGLQKYMDKGLPQIISNVYNAMKINKLERVFIPPKYPEKNEQIYFSLGDKMNNEKYRDILNEIMQCRFTSDKVAIIKSDIKSLADLEDLFFDADLTAEEIKAVLEELDVAEIAALAKRHPYKNEIEAFDLSESEIAFGLCLNKYIVSLSQEKQLLITKAISMIKDGGQQDFIGMIP